MNREVLGIEGPVVCDGEKRPSVGIGRSLDAKIV